MSGLSARLRTVLYALPALAVLMLPLYFMHG